ncbi:MAG: SDR family NAD(P)-dependent oxidoreductase [Candidatus Binatia bacterium]
MARRDRRNTYPRRACLCYAAAMDLGLRGKTAVVAGGTRGMGRATAELLAAEGCRTAVLGRTEVDLRDAEAALRRAGAPDVLALRTDLLVAGDVARAFATIGERWGMLHALVCAPGPNAGGTFDQLTDADWVRAFDQGVLTMVRCVRAALPLLRRAEFARIVTLAATSTRHQSAGLIAYTAAKSALVSATKNLARTLAPEGIVVNCLCPGWVLTPSVEGYLREVAVRSGLPPGDLDAAFRAGLREFGSGNDLGRIGRPEEIGVMAAWLCSPLAGFTIGATIPVDGGTDFI